MSFTIVLQLAQPQLRTSIGVHVWRRCQVFPTIRLKWDLMGGCWIYSSVSQVDSRASGFSNFLSQLFLFSVPASHAHAF